MKLNVPYAGNEKLKEVCKKVADSDRLQGFWKVANINAIDRMSINDHGPIHSKIVANSGLKILRILTDFGIEPSVVEDHDLDVEDAEVIVVLAASLHDLGHIVHRTHHEEFAIPVAQNLLPNLIGHLYDARFGAIMEAEILQAMYSHKTSVKPLTVEAGVVKVADALDMEEGRARIPFSEGEVTIHSVSALSIEEVSIARGEKKPVRITIEMSNSAGIFQLDNLLKPKLDSSGIGQYIETKVLVRPEGEKEKKIVDEYEL